MWCKQCRQDVPGVSAKGTEGKLRCVRCGTLLWAEAAAANSIGVTRGVGSMADHGLELETAAVLPDKPPVEFDDWDLDPDLSSFAHHRAAQRQAMTSPIAHAASLESMHPLGSMWHDTAAMTLPMTSRPAQKQETEQPPRVAHGSWMAWLIMAIGLMAFSCGGVLLGWSLISARTDLWDLGLPVTIGGQVVLLFGLILQLERMWQNNRYAVDKLKEVDERLCEIKQTQSLLGVNHGSSSQAFYAHMAGGANPSMLLADLKEQLDMLAIKLTERR
jgi:hypothetical protein